MRIEDSFQKLQRKHENDKWRPDYHFTPPEGWMNDPNGLIYFKGWYHLFYQYNPKACEWGSMHWGHAVSRDLFHWKDLPIALYPDQPYDQHKDGGCFSGSAVEKDGMLYCFYTSVAKKDGKLHQSQSLALSEDGVQFKKYEKNPVIEAPPDGLSGDFRDPKVLQVENQWYMVLGASVGGAEHGDGRVLLYRSEDLQNWDYVGPLLESKGKMGTMMECPDLFYLDGKWVLTCSPMYHPDGIKSMYCIGEIDFQNCHFEIQKIGSMDDGFDYYAPQSFLDQQGNRTVMAWQNVWAWMPWFQGWGPTAVEKWRGAMSIPRKVRLDEQMNLVLQPVESVTQLQGKKQVLSDLHISNEKQLIPLQNPQSYIFHMQCQSAKVSSKYIEIGIFADKDRYAKLSLDFVNHKLYFDKNTVDDYETGFMITDIKATHEIVDLQVFVDHSNVEIYVNGGEKCISCNVYPRKEQSGLWIRTPYKEAIIDKIEISEIKSVWE